MTKKLSFVAAAIMAAALVAAGQTPEFRHEHTLGGEADPLSRLQLAYKLEDIRPAGPAMGPAPAR